MDKDLTGKKEAALNNPSKKIMERIPDMETYGALACDEEALKKVQDECDERYDPWYGEKRIHPEITLETLRDQYEIMDLDPIRAHEMMVLAIISGVKTDDEVAIDWKCEKRRAMRKAKKAKRDEITQEIKDGAVEEIWLSDTSEEEDEPIDWAIGSPVPVECVRTGRQKADIDMDKDWTDPEANISLWRNWDEFKDTEATKIWTNERPVCIFNYLPNATAFVRERGWCDLWHLCESYNEWVNPASRQRLPTLGRVREDFTKEGMPKEYIVDIVKVIAKLRRLENTKEAIKVEGRMTDEPEDDAPIQPEEPEVPENTPENMTTTASDESTTPDGDEATKMEEADRPETPMPELEDMEERRTNELQAVKPKNMEEYNLGEEKTEEQKEVTRKLMKVLNETCDAATMLKATKATLSTTKATLATTSAAIDAVEAAINSNPGVTFKATPMGAKTGPSNTNGDQNSASKPETATEEVQ